MFDGSFLIYSWFNVTVTVVWKYLLSFLLMGILVVFLLFLESAEYIYDSRRLGFISWQVIWYLFLSDLKSSLITSSALSLIMISILSIFECVTWSSSLSSLEEVKLIFIVCWIFHVSDFLRSFMISYKSGVILWRYSWTDRVLFSSLLLLYSIKLLLQKLSILTGLW